VSPDDRWLTGYLQDLRDAGDIVAMVVAETDPEKYANSPTGSLALERAVSNFGEAANRLHAECRQRGSGFEAQHPELELSDAIKTRAVLVHNYDGIDRHVLWKAATTDVARVTEEADVLVRGLAGSQGLQR
jgi:uncharacterized protein with HEPN domain